MFFNLEPDDGNFFDIYKYIYVYIYCVFGIILYHIHVYIYIEARFIKLNAP